MFVPQRRRVGTGSRVTANHRGSRLERFRDTRRLRRRRLLIEQLESRCLLAIITGQVNLFEDDGGAPGPPIADNTVEVGDTFFIELVASDGRSPAAGIIGLSVDFGWPAGSFEEIDSPFAPADATSPLVTTAFPLLPSAVWPLMPICTVPP